jgi:hypothetical protein
VLVDPNNLATGQCYNYTGGAAAAAANCYTGKSLNTGGATFLTLGGAAAGKIPAIPTGTMCGTSACQYLIINNGQNATFNAATPKFLSLSATDNWRPTDKLTINYGVRFDQYQFTGANTYNSPAR